MRNCLAALALCLPLFGQNTPVFPGSNATAQNLLVASNRYATTLSATVGSSDTNIPVASVAGLATPTAVTIENERLKICSVSGSTLVVCTGGRGFDGSTAASHAATKAVVANITAWQHNQMAAEIIAMEPRLANAVDTTQTYSNPGWLSAIALAKVTGLQTALDAKVDTTGNYTNPTWIASLPISKITNLQTSLDAKVDTTGNYTNPTWIASLPISKITNLQTSLDAKVDTTGNYTNPTWIASLAISKITNLQTSLDAKVDTVGSYTNPSWIVSLPISKITNLQTSLDAKAALLPSVTGPLKGNGSGGASAAAATDIVALFGTGGSGTRVLADNGTLANTFPLPATAALLYGATSSLRAATYADVVALSGCTGSLLLGADGCYASSGGSGPAPNGTSGQALTSNGSGGFGTPVTLGTAATANSTAFDAAGAAAAITLAGLGGVTSSQAAAAAPVQSVNSATGTVTIPVPNGTSGQLLTSNGSSAFGTALTPPNGALVGTTDVQTLVGKTVNGLSPTVMGYASYLIGPLNKTNSTTFSATPAFNMGNGDTQTITLTGNVTSSTISSSGDGQMMKFVICQDSTGSRTFSWPTRVKGGMTIGSTASTCSAQMFVQIGATNIYALTAGVPNQ